MTLYAKIKSELLLRGETVQDLLNATNLSPATISNIKKSRPYNNTYALLAEYFQLDIKHLMALPITREQILDGYLVYRFKSDYDVLETKLQSKILPLEDNSQMIKIFEKRKKEELARAIYNELDGTLSYEEIYARLVNTRIKF